MRCERLADNTLGLHLAGHWTSHTAAPAVTEVQHQLDASPPVRTIRTTRLRTLLTTEPWPLQQCGLGRPTEIAEQKDRVRHDR